MYPFERDVHYDFIEEQVEKANENGGQAEGNWGASQENWQ